MKKHRIRQLTYFFYLFLLLGMLLLFMTALSIIEKDQSEEDKTQLENILTQAAAACYAAEGTYPSDLQYLISHYGVQINESAYTVIYEPIASNLMPDITVLDNQP